MVLKPIDSVYIFIYDWFVKKRELDAKLLHHGWWLTRQGGNHEMWTNGEHMVAVPRHREINEYTAKGILNKATRNPAQKK